MRPGERQPVEACQLKVLQLATVLLNVIRIARDLLELRAFVDRVLLTLVREVRVALTLPIGLDEVLGDGRDFGVRLPRAVLVREVRPLAEILDHGLTVLVGDLAVRNDALGDAVSLQLFLLALLLQN